MKKKELARQRVVERIRYRRRKAGKRLEWDLETIKEINGMTSSK